MNYRLAFLLPALLGLAMAACSDDPDTGTPDASPADTGSLATVTPVPEVTATTRPAATDTQAATPAATSTPPSSPSFEYRGFQILADFTYAEPVEFPENTLMFIETGCTQCDGPTEALYRVWRNENETHVDLLIDAGISGADDARITSFALRPNLHDIVVTVCTECAGPPSDSAVTVYRSLDGGVTWRDILITEAGAPVLARAITEDGLVLSDLDGDLYYHRGSPIEPPEGAAELLHDSNRTGQLRWLAGDGSSVMDVYGRVIARVEPGSRIESVVLDRQNASLLAIGWGHDLVAGPFKGWAVTNIGPDGRLLGARSDAYLVPVTALDDDSVLGVMAASGGDSGILGYIDSSTARFTPIGSALLQPPFGDGRRPTGRNVLQGAVNGPFLRVTTGVNCLPIRSRTDTRSQELTCASDGTLVYDLKNTTTIGAREWTRVRLLDGREGYAVSGYLTTDRRTRG